MIGPNDIQAAAVAALAAKLPRVSVEPHAGVFDDKELGRYGALCPAVRVAVAGLGNFSRASSGEAIVPVHLAAVCLAKDVQAVGSARVDKLVAVQGLALSVALLLDKNQFGLSGVYQPDELRARNQYSSKGDELGIAIWQVLWTTRIVTGAAVDLSLAALQTLYVEQVPFRGPGIEAGADPLRDPKTEVVVPQAASPAATS